MEKTAEKLTQLVQLFVRNPNQVLVEAKMDEHGVLLTLRVAKEDMGMVIGKQGAMSNAIRTIMKSVGASEGVAVGVKILEPDGSERRQAE